MKELGLKDALGSILSLSEPWIIYDIQLNTKVNVVDVFIKHKEGASFKCEECDEMCSAYDTNIQRIRHLDIWQYRCYLNISTPRINCKAHGVKVLKDLPVSRPRSHYSFFFERLILGLCAHMPMSAVASHVGEPDSNLWRIFKHYVDKSVHSEIKLDHLKRVCVDETAIKRGHSYITIFTDYDNGNVIYVADGRKMEVFEEFKTWIIKKGGKVENIEIFSMDMSKSYKAGSKTFFEKAKIVFDHFHIKKGINQALDTVRKEEVTDNKELIKTKYLWLKNKVNLSRTQELIINDFLHDTSLKTPVVYKLKMEFDTLWHIQPLAVEAGLKSWIERAESQNLKPLNSFIQTLRNNWKGILLSMITKISNAVSEGINSKVQQARSRARGFRNYENFKAMVYYLGNNFNLLTHR